MMEQLLTATVATNLYWLGRYLERIEVTLLEVLKAYDMIIDVDRDAGERLFQAFGVTLDYKDASDFLHQAILGEYGANMSDAVKCARENAIISRSYIVAEAFGEIIELYRLFSGTLKAADGIDYKFIDQAVSLIREVWGTMAIRGHRRNSDLFFKLGKLVEEADLHFRFSADAEIGDMILNDIDGVFALLAPDLKDNTFRLAREGGTPPQIMDAVGQTVEKIIVT